MGDPVRGRKIEQRISHILPECFGQRNLSGCFLKRSLSASKRVLVNNISCPKRMALKVNFDFRAVLTKDQSVISLRVLEGTDIDWQIFLVCVD